MAERRMFHKNLMMYDRLVDMGAVTLKLYLFLNLQADDDGFVGNPNPIMKMAKCSKKNLQELIDSGFILQFDSGVVAITHWRVHNQIRKDRYKPTRYIHERNMLFITQDGMYTLDGRRSVTQLPTQDSKEEASSVQSNLVQFSEGKATDRGAMAAPSLENHVSSFTDFEKDVFNIYSQICFSLKPCSYLSNKTRKAIKQLQALGWTKDSLTAAFQKAQQTPFLAGENRKGWQADIDWLCNDDNLRKLLDGKYINFTGERSQVPMGCTGLGEAEMEAIQLLLADKTLGD